MGLIELRATVRTRIELDATRPKIIAEAHLDDMMIASVTFDAASYEQTIELVTDALADELRRQISERLTRRGLK